MVDAGEEGGVKRDNLRTTGKRSRARERKEPTWSLMLPTVVIFIPCESTMRRLQPKSAERKETTWESYEPFKELDRHNAIGILELEELASRCRLKIGRASCRERVS